MHDWPLSVKRIVEQILVSKNPVQILPCIVCIRPIPVLLVTYTVYYLFIVYHQLRRDHSLLFHWKSLSFIAKLRKSDSARAHACTWSPAGTVSSNRFDVFSCQINELPNREGVTGIGQLRIVRKVTGSTNMCNSTYG